eukprot:gnl/TRDRNA2_/TRDRNA2_171884_c2_seq2.p1 gnl/TRDRNA2_/TRDRNA2_171884_c2~~gnl/TRDRNA2_/TRDRNA2_171884_c2_seq2.p1  ORF type:complete len:1154 (-),score=217.53 gnl/TRDRNA2_/TRDRNA2_171884_c2_seq2:87-3071(-)
MDFEGSPSVVWGDADVKCLVDRFDERYMTVEVLADIRHIIAGHDYQITVQVYNPVGFETGKKYMWLLETEANSQDPPPAFRDKVHIEGYSINNRLSRFEYVNEDPFTKIASYDGMAEVPGLYFQLRFPSKLEYKDTVHLQAPMGFEFEHPQENGVCNNFRWEPVEELYLKKSEITCSKDKMHILLLEDDDYTEETDIKFRIDTRNPKKTPHIMLNMWKVAHYRATGVIVSSEAKKGWDIKPQLVRTVVALIGAQKAAASKSSMAITFLPISDADQLVLTAKAPAGFDFTGCSTSTLGHEVIETNVEFVRVRASMSAGEPIGIRIDDFKLGRGGGQTEFDIFTRLNAGQKMDEAYNFLGFRLPGRVTVLKKQLLSIYQREPEKYPVASLWKPRMGEDARAVFQFKITMQANIGMHIYIASPHYVLRGEGFKIIDIDKMMATTTTTTTTSPLIPLPETTTQEPVDLDSDAVDALVSSEVTKVEDGQLTARLDGVLWTDVTYEVSFSCITAHVPDPQDSMWTVEIWDDGELPENTNDGLQEGFQLVHKVAFALTAGKSPPMANVIVELQVDPKGARPTELVLVAPPFFDFPDNCLYDAGQKAEVKSCERTMPVKGLAAAKLTLQDGGLREPTEYLRIIVKTPASNIGTMSWFMEARDRFTNRQIGWAEDPVGLEIRQMLGAGVLYPALPEMPGGEMAFKFSTAEKVDEGGMLRVGYPKDFSILCGGEFLKQISLLGEVTCVNYEDKGYFELSLPLPLPPGSQSFTVTSSAPTNITVSNHFWIMVLDNNEEDRQVVDAAMFIPGVPLQQGLSVIATELVWSNSDGNKPASVTMGFELTGELPLKAPPLMAEILIQCPPDFTQTVKRLSHIEQPSDPMPFQKTGWVDYSNPTRLRFFLDTDQTAKLALGRYRIQFPVWVPGRLPGYNVWSLTICEPSEEGCLSPNSPHALVTFPLAGFALGQVHPQSEITAVSGSPHRHLAAAYFLSALGLVCSLLMPR